MSGYTCPIEGCDYGEQGDKSKAALRQHVNASRDHPTWDDVEAQVADDDQDGGGDQAGDDVGRQWGGSSGPAGDDDPDDPAEAGDGADDDGADDTGDTGGFTLPISGRLLVAGFAGLCLLVLVVQYRSGADDGSDDSGTPVTVEADDVDAAPTDADRADDAGEAGDGADEGGLLTGGVVDE